MTGMAQKLSKWPPARQALKRLLSLSSLHVRRQNPPGGGLGTCWDSPFEPKRNASRGKTPTSYGTMQLDPTPTLTLPVASRAYRPGPYSPRESILAAWDREYLHALGVFNRR